MFEEVVKLVLLRRPTGWDEMDKAVARDADCASGPGSMEAASSGATSRVLGCRYERVQIAKKENHRLAVPSMKSRFLFTVMVKETLFSLKLSS